MTYLELYALGEQMMTAWDRYCRTETAVAGLAYSTACDTYEAAELELELDKLQLDHEPGCNVAGEQS